jgi:hypothetical protein
MSRKQIKQICRIIVKWCLAHLGKNHRIKKKLKIETVYNTTIFDGFAEYDIDDDYRIIRIFMDYTPTIEYLLKNIIHEYCHDLQPVTTKYDKLQKKYGYKNHPLEKQARALEERFYRVCWNDVRGDIDRCIN